MWTQIVPLHECLPYLFLLLSACSCCSLFQECFSHYLWTLKSNSSTRLSSYMPSSGNILLFLYIKEMLNIPRKIWAKCCGYAHKEVNKDKQTLPSIIIICGHFFLSLEAFIHLGIHSFIKVIGPTMCGTLVGVKVNKFGRILALLGRQRKVRKCIHCYKGNHQGNETEQLRKAAWDYEDTSREWHTEKKPAIKGSQQGHYS